MPLNVSPNVNLDTIRNLDASKTYFLSSTTGQVKEASWWMRFKCAIGVQSARQKVANLVEAVRTTLLDAAGKTGDDAKLDADIRTVSLKSMVKGSVIKDIASRFSVANANMIAKTDAAKLAASSAETFATRFRLLRQKGVDAKVFSGILKHAFKAVVGGELPMENDLDGKPVLDEARFKCALDDAAYRAANLVDEITRSGKLNGGSIDRLYAQHIVDTLFEEDGTRNERPVNDLKTPMQVKVDVAFKLGKDLLDNRVQIVHSSLQKMGVDPEKKLGEILSFCNGDKELEDYVLEIAPSLCLNTNNELRSDDTVQKKIAAIKESLEEIKELQKSYPGTAAQIKDAMSLLESTAFPKGTLAKIAKAVESCSFTRTASLTSRSSRSAIFKAMDEFRKALWTVQTQVNPGGAGSAESVTAKNIAMTLILSKLGPGVVAKLPHILSGRECCAMRSISKEISTQIHYQDPNVISACEGEAYDFAQMDIADHIDAVSVLIDTLNFEREQPVPVEGEAEFDINDEESLEIRWYLEDIALEQAKPKSES